MREIFNKYKIKLLRSRPAHFPTGAYGDNKYHPDIYFILHFTDESTINKKILIFSLRPVMTGILWGV